MPSLSLQTKTFFKSQTPCLAFLFLLKLARPLQYNTISSTGRAAMKLPRNCQFINQSGFTLIEIMIVVVIIAILAAIAIPVYYNYTTESQEFACLSEAKAYSNHIYYLLNDQDDNTRPTAPTPSACLSITDAAGWTTDTAQPIIAVAKSPSNARIECDIPNGSPCRILP